MNIENGINRLLLLGHDTAEAGRRMLELAPRFEQLANRHLTGHAPLAISAFNLFQTPREVAAKMAAVVVATVKPGARILEPSVGLGRLFEPFAELDGLRENWLAIENARECVDAVRRALKRLEVKERDFLETSPAELGGFDAVIMNPPFKQGRDIKHIQHAATLLNPGGVLVSLCYNGAKQNRDLRPIVDTWEILPENSFREAGTAASVAMLTIRKH